MNIEQYVVLRYDDQSRTYKLISTNCLDKLPIKIIDRPSLEKIPDGSLLELKSDKITQQYEYKKHPYEIAVVLSVNPNHSRAFIYGNKIGEKIIPLSNRANPDAVLGIERGDEILLLATKDEGLIISHNITQASLKQRFHGRYGR